MSTPRLLTLGLAAACALLLAAPLSAHRDDHDHPQEHEPAATPAPKPIRLTLNAAGGVNPWNHLDFRNDPNAFQFAIVSDRTGGARAGVFEDAVAKLNLLQPEFVMSVGDLIEGYTHDKAEINAQWDQFQGFIRQLEMPFFYVPGNHDHANPTMAGIWRERFGRAYYSFVYRDVLFLCLNSQEPEMHHISAAETEWVRATLAAHPAVRWTLVFLHSPLWEYADSAQRGWDAVEAALQGRKYTVFAGHFHSYLKRERLDSRYYILATTGGGSGLRGPAYGEFDQVAWVTMMADGPHVANLMLDGIRPDDIRTPESRAIVEHLSESVMTSDIIWLESGQQPSRRLELRSANPTAQPVEIRFAITPAARLEQGFATAPDGRSAFTLQPHASRATFVELSGPLPTENHQASAVGHVAWEAFMQSASGDPLRLNGRVALPVVTRLPIAAASGIVTDGNLDDWPAALWHDIANRPNLRSTKEGWTGPADSHFRVAFAHDATHLHLAVQVHDDEIVSQPDQAPWKQDGIEVRFDFRAPVHQRAARVFDDDQLRLFIGSSPAPGDGFDPAFYLSKSSAQLTGTTICNRQVPGGYIFEASIPLAAIHEKFGRAWQQDGVRINIAINDRDAGRDQAQLWWQPDWRTADNIPGSGTLFLK